MKTNPLPSLMPREVRSGVILPTGLFTYFRTRNTRDPECCSWRRPSVLRCRRNRRQCCASVLLMSNRTPVRLNAASQKPARTPQRRSGRLPVPGQSAPGRPQDDVEPSRSAITSSSRAGVVASDRGVDPHRRPTACPMHSIQRSACKSRRRAEKRHKFLLSASSGTARRARPHCLSCRMFSTVSSGVALG